jgi:hypothetical protein
VSRYTPLWLQQGSYAASVDRRLLSALWPAAAMNGGAVSPGTAMAVNIAPGYVAIPVQSAATTALCAWDAVESVALNPAPGAGLNRIDVIYAQARGNDIDSGSNNDFIFGVLTGTAAASPVAPSPLPNNSVAVAQVYVPAQSATVTQTNITLTTMGRLGGSYHARMHRVGVWASVAGTTPFGFDTATFPDPANMWSSGSTGFVVPVRGIWQIISMLSVVATAAGQTMFNSIEQNGVAIATATLVSAVAAPLRVTNATTVQANPGDVIRVTHSSNVAGLAGQTGPNVAFFSLDLLA